MEFIELLEIARRDRVDARIILMGDLFTKGPRPDLVVEAISELRAGGRRVESVCGNHDLRLMDALRKHDAGASLDDLSPAEAYAIRVLDRAGKLTAQVVGYREQELGHDHRRSCEHEGERQIPEGCTEQHPPVLSNRCLDYRECEEQER